MQIKCNEKYYKGQALHLVKHISISTRFPGSSSFYNSLTKLAINLCGAGPI